MAQLFTGPVLVTGGSGYLASRLLSKLAGKCGELRVLSRQPPVAAPMLRYFAGHPSGDPAILRDATRDVEVVFHLAGQTSLTYARQQPSEDHDANVEGLRRLIECLGAGRRPAVILAGTVTQAGLVRAPFIDESWPDAPITNYDVHKLAAERHLEAASASGVVRGVTLRLANVYGPGRASGSAERGVLNQMIRRAVGGAPLRVYGPGDEVRDYVFVDDVVSAFVEAAREAGVLAGRHFVIGTGAGRTLTEAARQVAAAVRQRLGLTVAVEHVEPSPGQEPITRRSYAVDARLFRRLAGWRPLVDFESGVDTTIRWCLSGADAQGRPARPF